jgi:starch synthase
MPSRVLFVSSEARPFASTGGLADVAAALPNELNRQGLPVDRVMPLYRKVVEAPQSGAFGLKQIPLQVSVPLGKEEVPADMYVTESHGGLTYFIGCEEFFDRTELYALPHREYRDNYQRFLFFQKAVVELIDALGAPFDLVHLNDWQTGMIPLFLKHGTHGTGRLMRERTVMTIHNLAYQGMYPATGLYHTNLPGNMLSQYPEVEFYGRMNFLKAGMVSANRVNTVSPTYAREILTPEYGCGLEGVLQYLPEPVTGIVNGVDLDSWNPETDSALSANYTRTAQKGKGTCKQSLLGQLGFPAGSEELPLFVMVTRLVEQKGLDVLQQAMEHFMSLPVCFALLGSGQKEYQDWVEYSNQRWPDRFRGALGYDADLSHQLEAAGDFYLMPSRFEPCGLNQMYSLRYGTLPIVNPTGGLKDTVTDLRSDPKHGTGFHMKSYTAESLLECMREAISLYHQKAELRKIRQRAMSVDVSWKKTAAEYIELYSAALA